MPTLNNRIQKLFALILCAIVASNSGCNSGSLESTVSGTVQLDGNAVGPGIVVFSPVSGGKPATGSVESN
jgi:hypothetical protein